MEVLALGGVHAAEHAGHGCWWSPLSANDFEPEAPSALVEQEGQVARRRLADLEDDMLTSPDVEHLTVALALVRSATPSDPSAAGDWLADGSRRKAVVVALNLVLFAGIAFLWFIGVVRDRIGEREDRFFATVFLGR